MNAVLKSAAARDPRAFACVIERGCPLPEDAPAPVTNAASCLAASESRYAVMCARTDGSRGALPVVLVNSPAEIASVLNATANAAGGPVHTMLLTASPLPLESDPLAAANRRLASLGLPDIETLVEQQEAFVAEMREAFRRTRTQCPAAPDSRRAPGADGGPIYSDRGRN